MNVLSNKKILALLIVVLFIACNEQSHTPYSAWREVPKDTPALAVQLDTLVKRTALSTPYQGGVTFYDPRIIVPLTGYLEPIKEKLVDYDFDSPSSCQVGLLAQYVSHVSRKELIDYLTKYGAYTDDVGRSWIRFIDYTCGLTGKPLKGIVADLLNAGFTFKNIIQLEHLSDPYILAHTDIDTSVDRYYSQKENVIKYLEAWIDLIQKQPKIRRHEQAKT